MRTIHGIAASKGIAFAATYLYMPNAPCVPTFDVVDVVAETNRFEQAVNLVDADLTEMANNLAAKTTQKEAQVFEAHRMFLQDPMFVGEIKKQISEKHLNAEICTLEVAANIRTIFENMEDEYFRQRSQDIVDVGNRLIRCLLGVPHPRLDSFEQPSIVVAETLFPSDTAQMDVSKVKGFITAVGGPTAHAAIFARSLGIPAVVGAGPEVLDLCTQGQFALLDGEEGVMLIEPDESTLQKYQEKQRLQNENSARSLQFAHEAAKTLDGIPIEVVANIGQVPEASQALEMGAEGVGLLRTEFLFIDRDEAAGEEEQYEIYKAIGDAFGTKPVVIRTMDIGGDKGLPYLQMEQEENPFLGLRGLRFCLKNPEIFKTQLHAIFRASVGHNLKIMFPMVSTVDEILKARQLVAVVLKDLDERKIPYADVEIGIMVEVPAAAVAADVLARYVDFFSIGTNDLTQYTLAADRTNASVQNLADAFHPAVLRLIQNAISAGHERGVWIGLCGELAGNALAVPLLLGMGLDEFSMGKASIPEVKEAIRKWSRKNAEEVVENALKLDDAPAVRAYLSSLQPG